MPSNYVQPIVTANNYGPAVNVISWFLGVTIVIFVATRLATKSILRQKFRRDDLLLVIATTFSVALIVSVSLQTPNGLGRHQSGLSLPQLLALQKATYAAQLLYISSLTLSKLSLLALFLHLFKPFQTQMLLIFGLGATTSAWGVSAFLAAAFQCDVPKAWEILGNACFNQTTFWLYFGLSNIVLEIIFIMVPITVLRNVRMPMARKLKIIGIFAARIFVIGAIVPELVFHCRSAGSTDYSFAAWPTVICLQFVQALSIITACIPSLKPFFLSLETGLIRLDDSRRIESRSFRTSGFTRKSAGLVRSFPSMMPKLPTSRNLKSRATEEFEADDIAPIAAAAGSSEDTGGWESESQASQSRTLRQTTPSEVKL